MIFNLDNQVALVTGGANGIGRGIVETLAEAGAKVIVADIDEKAGQETAASVDGKFIYLDVTDRENCQNVIKYILDTYDRLDILSANAGIFPQANIEDMTDENWDQMFDLNLKGTFYVMQPALKVMKEQNYGRVIITSSITGPITGFPGWAHYGATKTGQLGFMRSAALEYAKYGITVNAVQPGNVMSDGLAAQGEEYLDQQRAIIPTHELGEPKDIGYGVTFFASKESKFITGQTLVIDGGQILPEAPDAVL